MVKHQLMSKSLAKAFRPPAGRKEIWLPSFTITLLRTSYLPSNMACFQVPLNMNKLDIKDYLWNAYGIPVLSVRSYIQQQKVRAGWEGEILRRQNYWTRPKSTKRMIVELGEGENGGPFVWPEPPEDLGPWDNKVWKDLQDSQENQMGSRMLSGFKGTKEEAQTLADQAEQLLRGEKIWQPAETLYEPTRV